MPFTIRIEYKVLSVVYSNVIRLLFLSENIGVQLVNNETEDFF